MADVAAAQGRRLIGLRHPAVPSDLGAVGTIPPDQISGQSVQDPC